MSDRGFNTGNDFRKRSPAQVLANNFSILLGNLRSDFGRRIQYSTGLPFGFNAQPLYNVQQLGVCCAKQTTHLLMSFATVKRFESDSQIPMTTK